MTNRAIFQPRSLSGLIEANFSSIDISSENAEGTHHIKVDGEFLHTDIIAEQDGAENKFFVDNVHHLYKIKDVLYVDPATNSYTDADQRPTTNNILVYDSTFTDPVTGHVGNWLNSNKIIINELEANQILIKDDQPNQSSTSLMLYNESQTNSGLNQPTGTGTSIYFNNYDTANNILGHTVASIQAQTKVITDINKYECDLVFTIDGQEEIRLSKNQTDIHNLHLTDPTMNSDLNMLNHKIINLGLPINGGDALNKTYFDQQIIRGASAKANVHLATTAQITRTNEQIIDGVLTSSSYVLVKNQTSASENGVYISAFGPWTRRNDFDNPEEIFNNGYTHVLGGLSNTGYTYHVYSIGTLANGAHNIDTDDILFQIASINYTVQAPIIKTADLISLDYNSTNLKLLGGLNTIQDITTSSNVTFNSLTAPTLYDVNDITNTTNGLNINVDDLHTIYLNCQNIQLKNNVPIENQVYTLGLNGSNNIIKHTPIIHTATAPIIINAGDIQLDHNVINLKISSGKLNTIQDINPFSSVTFNTVTTSDVFTNSLTEQIANNGINVQHKLILDNEIYVNDIYEKTLNQNITIHNDIDMDDNDIINLTDITNTVTGLSITINDLNSIFLNCQNVQLKSNLLIQSPVYTLGINATNHIIRHVPIVHSATAPIILNSGDIQLDHNISNLKISSGKLNTIQDITPTSHVTLNNLTLNNISAGIPTRYLALNASNSVISVVPSLIIVEDLDFYDIYDIVNINLMTFSNDVSATAGTVNKINLWQSGTDIYGFGVSNNTLDYMADETHAFYLDNVRALRITHSGIDFRNTVGLAGTPNKVMLYGNKHGTQTEYLQSYGFGISNSSMDYAAFQHNLYTNGTHQITISTTGLSCATNISTTDTMTANAMNCTNALSANTISTTYINTTAGQFGVGSVLNPAVRLRDANQGFYSPSHNVIGVCFGNAVYHTFGVGYFNTSVINCTTINNSAINTAGLINCYNLAATTAISGATITASNYVSGNLMYCNAMMVSVNNKILFEHSTGSLYHIYCGSSNQSMNYSSGIRHVFRGFNSTILCQFELNVCRFTQFVECQAGLNVTSTMNLAGNLNFFENYLNGRSIFVTNLYGYASGAVSFKATTYHDALISDSSPLSYCTVQSTNRLVKSGFSDRRIKKNIVEPLESETWDLIKDVKIYKYNMKTNPELQQEKQDIIDIDETPAKIYDLEQHDGGVECCGHKIHYGVVLDETDNIFGQQGDQDEGYTIDYIKYVPLLLSKIQSQEKVINDLINRLDILSTQCTEIFAKIGE